MNYDDETLMAYADGELDAARCAEIDAAIAKDPALARRVERQRALRTEVAGAFAPVLEQPVPERLEKAARGGATVAATPKSGKILQFPARSVRAPSPPWRAREWAAMAASLVLGVLLSWRLFAPTDSGVILVGKETLVAGGELATVLESRLVSEQQRDDAVLIGLTFRSQDGSYCRSFTLRATKTAGLACRVGADWRIPITTVAELPAGGVQQAGAAIPPAILQTIEARMAGEPLDAAGEQKARLAGWDSKR